MRKSYWFGIDRTPRIRIGDGPWRRMKPGESLGLRFAEPPYGEGKPILMDDMRVGEATFTATLTKGTLSFPAHWLTESRPTIMFPPDQMEEQ